MAIITLPVVNFTPTPARRRAEVVVFGVSTPAGVTQLQVLLDPLNRGTRGNTTVTGEARVMTTLIKHDKLVADLNSPNQVVVTLTTSDVRVNDIVDFSSNQLPPPGMRTAAATENPSEEPRSDGASSDSAILV